MQVRFPASTVTMAPASEKLPVMYLMDSIIKNVGGDYLPAFSKNLPVIFPCVFEKVDADTKICLFKLRSTWNATFPSKKLLVLDIRVNVLDPAWPIHPLPPDMDFSSIRAKRKFLKKSVSFTSAQPGPYGQGQQHLPYPGSFVQNPAGALPHSYPEKHLGQVDVNELFAKLVSAGILKLPEIDSTSALKETSAQPAAEEVPNLTNFAVEELGRRVY